MNKLSRRDAGFTHIGDIIGTALRSYRKGNSEELRRIRDQWASIMEAPIAAHTTPVAFKNKRLTVHVSDSTLMHHLQFLKQDILQKLNQASEPLSEPQADMIQAITFKIGPIY